MRAIVSAMLCHAGAGCDGLDTWQPPAGAQALTVVRARPDGYPIWNYPYSGAFDELRLVIREASAWSTFWTTTVSTVEPVPPIDFASETIIAAGMGWRPTGGFHVEIPAAYRMGAFDIYVVVCETSPPRDAGVTAAETQPLTLARIPRIDETFVHFVEMPAVGACPAAFDEG